MRSRTSISATTSPSPDAGCSLKTGPLFLLSPANLGGKRATRLLAEDAEAPLARRLREGDCSLAELFSAISTLYFKSKHGYARLFAEPGDDVWVLTGGQGILSADEAVDRERVLQMGRAPLDPGSEALEALSSPVEEFARGAAMNRCVVFLGSLDPRRYLTSLIPVFGRRLLAPSDFKSLGQMQRGSLLLSCVKESRELSYSRVSDLLSRT